MAIDHEMLRKLDFCVNNTPSYFYSNVLYWFAKIYVKEFSKRISFDAGGSTLMVRNTIEDVRLTCIIMDCFVHAVVFN
jgi:hypothetical protein